MGSELCYVCDRIGLIKCSKCESITYCSKDHQREHWNDEHGTQCKSYKVKKSTEAGQYLVASRNIKAGHEIMVDEPLVIGPLGTSHLLCLTCYTSIWEKDFHKCPDCQWPICSDKCAMSSIHENECDILMRDDTKRGAPTVLGETPRYDLILILRCLLLRKKNPSAWKELLKMESHGEMKRAEAEPFHMTAVEYLKTVCGDLYDEDLIHRIRGAITTNSLQIRGPNGAQLRALYPNIRFFNHSCRPNIHLSSTLDGFMVARASVDIKKGTELNISYTPIDSPYWERQVCLSESYYFTCCCSRCSDATELNTFFSNPRCLQCRKELLIPIHTSKSDLRWSCRGCMTDISNEEMLQEVDEWMFRLEMNDLFGSGTPFKICQALKCVEMHFHNKHFIFLKTCQSALQKLAFNFSLEALKIKKEVWTRMLHIYTMLEPGLTKRRGMTLSELAASTYNYAKRARDKEQEEEDRLSEYQLDNLCNESLSHYNEAYNILRREPRDTPEAKLSLELLLRMEEINHFKESAS